MPNETKQAVEWALKQEIVIEEGYAMKVKDDNGNINIQMLVDKVSEYFNSKNIEYGTFSFDDLKPYL